ncbi:hypothetical protein PpBr36_08683 [Pyricularia pennisetigena]|uniref:hypothetical protein n=1 Tax=Pyricularia pennisetigena TaxID=1578925 RepID=UPI00114D8D37|nr:hypothetical protein PpBr36_08683 [Pyricularia pennisetigena]TLS24702.1 hypothetical protein PpBr36_08683 [Pyricularia pennisetigena]
MLPQLLPLLLIALCQVGAAQDLTVFSPPSSSTYKYHGCYNETTGLPGTSGSQRAIDGKHKTSPGSMTVQSCLDFCGSDGTVYKFAGVEFSRECWCGNILSGLSAKVDDDQCNTACDGNASIACGGPLKLSVYVSGAPKVAVSPTMFVAGITAVAVGIIAMS